jgi:hypothetical protein
MFQDVVTKRIVGWQVSKRMTAELVTDALKMALRRGYIKRGCIVHTDRGSQYASNEYRKLIRRACLKQSMSGKGNCYDNAQAESFFSRFKTELVEGGVFTSLEEARIEIFDYIDCYYNRKRRHSSLGNISPEEFERRLKTASKQGCGNAASDENVENPKKQVSHILTDAWKSPKRLSHIPTASATTNKLKGERVFCPGSLD